MNTNSKVQKSSKYSLIFIFMVTILMTGIYEIVWLVNKGNTPQKYTDIVIEQGGGEFANKSIELFLYWSGVILGLFIITLCVIFYKKFVHDEEQKISKWSDSKLVILGINVFMIGSYLFYGSINPVLVMAELIIMFSICYRKEHALHALCCYFMILYSITGLYRLYIFCGGNTSINSVFVSIAAFLFTFFLCIFATDKINSVIMVIQVFTPFLLYIYLTNKYNYGGETILLNPEKAVYIFIFSLIAVFEMIALISVWKQEKNEWMEPYINIGTSVAIMAFQRFSGSGYVMLNDMHHPAENTIAYNEIANLGRQAFSEYVPVSGLYSYIQGFFLEIFGKGNYTAYSLSNNVYYLVIIILLVIALRLHLNSMLTFFASIFIFITDYSRTALIIPFMLILLSRKLLSKSALWITVWIVFCWCYGLYYPAYGAAIGISLFPIGIYQVIKICREFKTWSIYKKSGYAIVGLLLIGGIVFSFPLILGTLKHVLDMRDGMLYLDGVTIFGQALPENFLPFLKEEGILYTFRIILGYVVRFTVPMLVVWIAYFSAINIFRKKKDAENNEKFTVNRLSAIACAMFPIVCFYFSLYRMGAGNLFNRAVYIIDFSLIITAIILYQCGKEENSKYQLILMAIFVCTIGNSNGINGLSGKYYKEYTVPENYVYTNERTDIPRLGEGFVEKELMSGIEEAAEIYNGMDHSRNYFALFANKANGQHGMAYDEILNIKGTAMLETMTVRGYSIAVDTAEKLCASDAIVGNKISPADHYYLYKWLCTGGKYIWSDDKKCFYPVTNESEEEVRKSNSKVMVSMPADGVGRIAASLGNSMESLQKVLSEKEIAFTTNVADNVLELDFAGKMDGNQIDYIYLDIAASAEFSPFIMGDSHVATNGLEEKLMKHEYNSGIQIVVEWQDDEMGSHTMKALLENGKILMPVGAGTGWLNHSHSEIRIWLEKDGQKIEMLPTRAVQLYTVRDVSIR